MANDPIRSKETMYPAVPDSVLPHYTDEELCALLDRAEAEVEASPLTLDEVTAHLRSLIK
ncbi:MAG: hypothetical protein LBJ08_12135 [Bifidobacteriaceae bacterium]|nr:hypothetical protein [Bifidobacteriaceae bacterium]